MSRRSWTCPLPPCCCKSRLCGYVRRAGGQPAGAAAREARQPGRFWLRDRGRAFRDRGGGAGADFRGRAMGERLLSFGRRWFLTFSSRSSSIRWALSSCSSYRCWRWRCRSIPSAMCGDSTGARTSACWRAFYNALLLATTLVFTASNAFFFLIAWEIMALTAYCLVSFEHEKAETRNAGVLYFIMSHIGTGCLILGFLLLFQAAGGQSPVITASTPSARWATRCPPGRRDAVFLLFLFGFGVKAGIVPLHIWLPEAHPVAPSNVSALLSGRAHQDRHLRAHARAVRLPGHAAELVGRHGPDHRDHLRRAGRALRADGARPQAAAGLSQHREHRHHPHGAGRVADVPAHRTIRCWRRWR